MTTEIVGHCWHCGADLWARDFGRETNCLGCGKPTRVCRNCRWYAPDRSNQCEEPMAERVMDKVRANFCEFFEPSLETGGDEGAGSGEDLVKEAEDLFKT